MHSRAGREMRKKRVKVDKSRWPGIYQYELERRYHGRPDFAYTITFKDPVTGKKVWEKVGNKSEGITPQLCSELRAERIRTARHGNSVKTSKQIQREVLRHNRLLGEIADTYFRAKEDSLKGYKTDINRWELHLKPLFCNRRVTELSEMDTQRLRASMKGKAPATIWNTLELLRRLCNWGSRNRLCPGLSFMIKMPNRDNEVIEFLTSEEAARLNNVLNGWKSKDAVRMLKVAMLTGLRRGEIFRLENKDLDWRHNLIRLRNPKGGKSLRVPMSGPVAAILKEQSKHRNKVYPKSPFIFPGAKGKQRVDCSAVTRIKKRAELPEKFRIFHGLRHHFAVTLANSGKVDLSMIGTLLTHKSHTMTKRYAAFLPETMKEASELAASLVQENTGKEKAQGQELNKAFEEER